MLLLTGANGQIGQALKPLLPDALCPRSSELDIADYDAVQAYVEAHGVTKIINCAGYTAVDAAEDDAERAFLVNAKGPENLARTGAALIHLSTDYVFDGRSSAPYLETDSPNPLSVYGRTKLEGEEAILKHASSAVILRTSWVYSPFGSNFFKLINKLAGEGDVLRIVFDQIGTPTLAGDLAQAVCVCLPLLGENDKAIYHYSNEGVASWYDFAWAIVRQSGLSCSVVPIETRERFSKAVRPRFSVLNKAKIKNKLGIQIPHWMEGLDRCAKQFS